MSENNKPWLAKLAAWTHDPAEKALVLLRDPVGHEGGTVRDLRQRLFPGGLPSDISEAVKRGDHWASAADRPQFGSGGRNAWAQVRFDQQPVLIHPLSGEEYDLGKLADIDPAHIKAVSQTHFDELVVNGDAKKTALNFWRFGPEIDADIRTLWRLLPADTRVPDHTIWAHLDLTAAFATAFTADTHGDAALLAMSFGPVQDFIAAARTTSDLWAGSHLLSRLAWEGLKIIASEIGPDAVIFPQLRGVPQVDLWLQNEIGLPGDRFANCDWATEKTDANPLYGAALPNKFVAIVPASRAEELARKVTEAVRDWILKNAQTMLAELLDKSGLDNDPTLPCHAQLAEQLAGFPEVHWASVPFSLVAANSEGKAEKNQPALAAASHPFFGKIEKPGFLGSPVWQVLAKEIEVEGTWFFVPNPGVLYPAIYDLLDRVAASAKSVRPFAQTKYEGYRCDLTGDAEWLTTDRTQLAFGKQGRKDAPTLWNKAAQAFPGLFRKGEHLSALAMLKRMWPRTFAQEIAATLVDIKVQRYVVSTHTMALATSLERWIEGGGLSDNRVGEFERLIAEASTALPTALPRRLIKKLYIRETVNSQTRDLAARLPGLLDQDDLSEDKARVIIRDVEKLLGAKPEAYYAFILLDGDRMGAWLSGTDPDYLLTYGDTWHPKIRHTAAQKFPQLAPYLGSKRAVSPARHMAISAALNDFALLMARHVVEDLCKGKLIYAGGDDVLAMVSVDDLLRCLTLLRLAYSGVWPAQEGLADLLKLGNERNMAKLKRGHAMLDGQLLRLMGEKATASAGAVVAHHQTPLSRVMRELRATEKRAKTQGGRDAFSINLLKRSGGAVHLTLPWIVPGEKWSDALKGTLTNTPMALLIKLRDSFVGKTSRRAAYLTQGWLEDLPTISQIGGETLRNLLSANLQHQLKRQGGDSAGELGRLLAQIACAVGENRNPDPRDSLKSPEAALVRDMLAVAEFLAREGRTEYREKI